MCENCDSTLEDYWWKEGDEIKWFCSIKCLVMFRDKDKGYVRYC
jgi:hypothetical protein